MMRAISLLGFVLALGCGGRAMSVAEADGASSASGSSAGGASAGSSAVSGSNAGASAGSSAGGNASAGISGSGPCAVLCPSPFIELPKGNRTVVNLAEFPAFLLVLVA
jgi:hypothetical protein